MSTGRRFGGCRKRKSREPSAVRESTAAKVNSPPLHAAAIHGITVIPYAILVRPPQESHTAGQPEARNRIRGGAGDFLPSVLPGPPFGYARPVPGHRVGGGKHVFGNL